MVIYLGRSRLHRNRANLLQTLHTCAAFNAIGVATELELPPWRRLDCAQRLREIGVDPALPVRARLLLNRSWAPSWFAGFHRKRLLAADAVYLRNPELSLALAQAGIPHHFEVHQVRALEEAGQLEALIRHHRNGLIQWLVPISQAAATALASAGARPERMHIAPSGVDVDAYRSVPDLTAAQLENPRALYLGRISRTRGLDVLLDLAERRLCEVMLVGEQEDAVAPHPAISVRPFVAPATVPRLYDDASLVLLPYQPSLPHSDAISPLKLFEAMAAGRPIVVSDLPAIREVVEHGRTGLLVPPADPAAWARAVGQLRAEPALALELARNARAESERFSWRQRVTDIAARLGLRREAAA